MDQDNVVPERRGALVGGRKSPKAQRGNGTGARKANGGDERMRVTYRFRVETWQRIGIHCRLARVDETAFVERAALMLLRQVGKGQDVFDRPDSNEDRQDTTAA